MTHIYVYPIDSASQVPSDGAASGLPEQEHLQPGRDQPAAGGPHHLDQLRDRGGRVQRRRFGHLQP